MKRFFLCCILLHWILPSSAQSTKFDEILEPCGFARCYANYYVGKVQNGNEWKYCLLDSNKNILTQGYYDDFDWCKADTGFGLIDCGVNFENGFLLVKRNNKWGFLNEKGVEIIKCEYDEIKGPCRYTQSTVLLKYAVGVIKTEGMIKYYLLNPTNEKISKSGYEEMDLAADFGGISCSAEFVNGFLKVKRNSKWGYLNEEGIEIIKCAFDSVENFTDGYAYVSNNKKWGFINDSGDVVIDFVYDNVEGPYDNYYVVGYENGMKGILKHNGLPLTEIKYDEIDKRAGDEYRSSKLFHNDLVLVKIKSRYGYVNKAGELQISCKYDDATVFYENYTIDREVNIGNGIYIPLNMACVKEEGKWGVIDTKGKYIIENKYDSIIQLNKNFDQDSSWLAVVVYMNKSILINKKNEKITDFPFIRIEPFSSGLAAVLDSTHQWGFLDTNFALVIPCVYNCIHDNCISSWCWPPKFTDQLLCRVNTKSAYIVINEKGQAITPWSSCSFDIPTGENYYAVFCLNNKYGLIDYKLKVTIPAIYDDFISMSVFQPVDLYGECSSEHYYIKFEDLIPVRINNKFGYINRQGSVKIPIIYDSVSVFEYGKATVKLNGVDLTIDKEGNIIQ